MIKRQSDRFSNYLSRELNYDDERNEVISYGMQIFLGILLNTLSILIIAYVLNIFKTTLAAAISYIVFRRIIGGGHCETFNKCFFSGTLFIILLGVLGEKVELVFTNRLFLILSIYFLAVAAALLWVPAGTEKKVIKNRNTRKKIKIETIILLTIWILLCIYLMKSSLSKYIFSSSLGVALAFFLVTPLGYRLLNLKLFKFKS